MARFQVQQSSRGFDPRDVSWRVVDTEDADREVGRFDTREEAQAHADRVNQGPFDLDEQEAWQDPDEDEEWGTWERWD